MKILCVSDQLDPLVYSTNAKERFASIDAVLCAGDLPSDYIDFIVSTLNKPTFFVFGNHNLTEFSYYHRRHAAHKGAHPMFQKEIANYDLSCNHGAVYAGFKVVKEPSLAVTAGAGKKTPLLVAGASGSLRYNNGLCQFTDRQMFLRLLALVPALLWNKFRYGRYLDIFLTHAAPRHIHDREDACHKGFECFNWFIRHFKPAYLVHGHIHLYDLNSPRFTTCGGTSVVNAFSHCIIELQGADDE